MATDPCRGKNDPSRPLDRVVEVTSSGHLDELGLDGSATGLGLGGLGVTISMIRRVGEPVG